MRLLDLLAEALSAEKESTLRDKFVVGPDEKGFQPNKITEKEFNALLAIDESPNGKYLNWILPRYVKLDRTERARFFQDGHNDRVKELLVFFDNPSSKSKIKKAINNPKIKEKVPNIYLDINQYNSLRDFENILSALQSFFSDEVISPDDQNKNTSSGGEPGFVSSLQYPVKIGVTPSGFTVYKIPQLCKSNKECFREYRQLVGCRGESDSDNLDRPALDRSNRDKEAPTRGFQVHYCTRFPGQFDNYLSSGPYYIFINWGARRIYQLHYETGQLKDENDEEINGYNSKLQNEFLQFLLDTEGRIPSKSLSFNLDLSKFKKGDIDGFPIYQIGPLYYIDAKTGEDQKNKLVYFDSETSQLKNSDGTSASTKNALRDPYNKLIMYLYKNGLFTPEKGSKAYGDWMAIRIFGNIDVPPTAAPKINGNINLSGTSITSLPNNLTINGDLDLSNTKLERLPDNLKVAGILNLKGTGLTAKPGIAAKVIQD